MYTGLFSPHDIFNLLHLQTILPCLKFAADNEVRKNETGLDISLHTVYGVGFVYIILYVYELEVR